MPIDSPTTTDYLIWWTPDYDCPRHLPSSVPEYIRKELSSRLGRAGRGRLWVAAGIPIETMTDPERAPEECSGIVIHASDAPSLKGLPGWITDLAGRIP